MTLTVWALIMFLNGQPDKIVDTYNSAAECHAAMKFYAPLVAQTYTGKGPANVTLRCMKHDEWKDG